MTAISSGCRKATCAAAALLLLAGAAAAHQGTVTPLQIPVRNYLRVRVSGNGSHVFVEELSGPVWMTSRDGGDRRQVVPGDPARWFNVDYSGRWVCFELNDPSGLDACIVRDTETLSDVTVGYSLVAGPTPVLSGDGRTAAFFSDYLSPLGAYVARADGTGRPVLVRPRQAVDGISYDGRRVIWLEDGVAWGAEAETFDDWPGIQRPITSEPRQVSRVMLSGDGNTIVYVTNPSLGFLELKSARWDGSDVTSLFLSSTPGGAFFLAGISYDGKWITFTKDIDLRPQVFVASTDGSILQQITDTPPGYVGRHCAMDASGTSIVFALTHEITSLEFFYRLEAPLTVYGDAVPGGTVIVRLGCPRDAGLRYAIAGARESDPGFLLPDGRRVPLVPDRLTRRSLRLDGFRGQLGEDGIAFTSFEIPPETPPWTMVYLASVTAEGNTIPSIRSISNAVHLVVLPPFRE